MKRRLGLIALCVLAICAAVAFWTLRQRGAGISDNSDSTGVSEAPVSSATSEIVFKGPAANSADAQAVLEAIKIAEFLERTNRIRAIFSEWSKKDPFGAAGMLIQMEPKHRDYEAVGIVARALSLADVPSALAFADQVQDYRVGDFIRRIALETWGQKAPGDAGAYVLSNFPAERQGRALSVFAKSWSTRDPASALAFAAQIEDAGAKSSFLATAYDSLAASNPQKAVESWSALPKDSPSRDDFAAVISRNWSQSDPSSAAAWATSLPEEDPARSAALSQSIAAWSRSDPMKTSEFMDKLPSGRSLDEAIVVFVNAVASFDPEGATQWAGSVVRLPLRRAAYLRIADHYAGRDAAEAQKWLDSLSTLPESWQEALFRRLTKDGSSVSSLLTE